MDIDGKDRAELFVFRRKRAVDFVDGLQRPLSLGLLARLASDGLADFPRTRAYLPERGDQSLPECINRQALAACLRALLVLDEQHQSARRVGRGALEPNRLAFEVRQHRGSQHLRLLAADRILLFVAVLALHHVGPNRLRLYESAYRAIAERSLQADCRIRLRGACTRRRSRPWCTGATRLVQMLFSHGRLS